jgi:hypothetical protein
MMQMTPWGMTTILVAHTIHMRLTLEVNLKRGRRRGEGPRHPAQTAKRKGGGSLICQALLSNKLEHKSIDRAPKEINREEMV